MDVATGCLSRSTNVHIGLDSYFVVQSSPLSSEAPVSEKMAFSDIIVDRWFGYVAFERHPTFNMGQNRFEGTLANLQTLHRTKVEPPSGIFGAPLSAPNLETLILHNCGISLLQYLSLLLYFT